MIFVSHTALVVSVQARLLSKTNSPKQATMLMYENQGTKCCKPTITVYSTIDTEMMLLPISRSFFLPSLSLPNPCKQRKISKKLAGLVF